jgi:hypothetical protein
MTNHVDVAKPTDDRASGWRNQIRRPAHLHPRRHCSSPIVRTQNPHTLLSDPARSPVRGNKHRVDASGSAPDCVGARCSSLNNPQRHHRSTQWITSSQIPDHWLVNAVSGH